VRHTGIACVGVLLVAFAAFRVQARSEIISTEVEVPATATAAMPLVAPEPLSVTPLPSDAPAAASQDRSRTSRRRRGRNFNRYPGPIPTPAEWVPPDGPVRIALQAGHWRANEAPDELRGLRDNGTASRGKPEWEVNLEIARRASAMLVARGYEVDILPAVVPPDYRAHLFISIHADGSNDARASGFRVGSPRRDATGRASQIAELLQRSYGEATGLRRLPDVTRRMSNYYAFNFRRYEHALHPMTIAVILETGFLTSASDWRVIVDDPDRAARGIVAAVTAFDITPPPSSLTALVGELD
jgi:N-acetylmuramoyl-L-alanine amidase